MIVNQYWRKIQSPSTINLAVEREALKAIVAYQDMNICVVLFLISVFFSYISNVAKYLPCVSNN